MECPIGHSICFYLLLLYCIARVVSISGRVCPKQRANSGKLPLCQGDNFPE